LEKVWFFVEIFPLSGKVLLQKIALNFLFWQSNSQKKQTGFGMDFAQWGNSLFLVF